MFWIWIRTGLRSRQAESTQNIDRKKKHFYFILCFEVLEVLCEGLMVVSPWAQQKPGSDLDPDSTKAWIRIQWMQILNTAQRCIIVFFRLFVTNLLLSSHHCSRSVKFGADPDPNYFFSKSFFIHIYFSLFGMLLCRRYVYTLHRPLKIKKLSESHNCVENKLFLTFFPL
jgi:hypothetical protein